MRGALLALALIAGACDGDGGGTPVTPVWPADFETAWTGVRDCRQSAGAHDLFYIRVFAPADVASAYTGGAYPFEEGAVIAKGEYDDAACTDLVRVSAMKKLPGGGWQWQRADAQRVLAAETTGCAECHSACQDTDWTCTEP